LIKVEDEGGGDTDGGEEGVGAAVIAHGNAPPVFELSKHVFDFMALPVEGLVVGDLYLAIVFWRDGKKEYVVETNTKVIQRCLLMTTDPGDLVLDITCGSGTTAYVAEQWGPIMAAASGGIR
jgi:hypothetical protein